MEEKKVVLKIYNKDYTEVAKEVEAKPGMIPFGTVKKVMALVDCVTEKESGEIKVDAILKNATNVYEDAVSILERFFPNIQEEEWNYIDCKDMLNALKDILLYYFKSLLNMPASKND